MATPTITQVSPAVGRTSGRNLVTIEGNNFRLYDEPSAYGRVPTPADPVRVAFGSQQAARVWVLSSTKLIARVPPASPGAVGISVTNLDSNGVPIPTETVTLPSAYTYKRPNLVIETPIASTTRAMLHMLKQQLLENTALTTHTDFEGTPLGSVNVTAVAALPAVLLVGPRVETSAKYRTNALKQVQLADGSWRTLRATLTVDLEFDVVLLSNSQVELLALMTLAAQAFHRNYELAVPRDPQAPSAGEVQLCLGVMRGFVASNHENESNLRQAMGTVRVYGLDLDETDSELEATPGAGAAMEPGWEVADFAAAGSVQRPDGVIIGTGSPSAPASGSQSSGPYQLKTDLGE